MVVPPIRRRQHDSPANDKGFFEEGGHAAVIASTNSKDERKVHARPPPPVTAEPRSMFMKVLLVSYYTALCYTGCMALRELLPSQRGLDLYPNGDISSSISSSTYPPHPEPNNDFETKWNELVEEESEDEWSPVGSTEHPYTPMAPQLDLVWARGWYNAVPPPDTVPIDYYNRAGLGGKKTPNKELGQYFPEQSHPCGTFWIRTTDLRWWIEKRLPQMNCEFTLITGDAITGIPDGIANADKILQHPHLNTWYAQNVVSQENHPKLKPIPVGLPIHYGFKDSPSSAHTVETMLEIRKQMPPFAKRSRKILFDVGTMKGGGPRGAARKEAHDQLLACKDTRVEFMPPTPTVETWKKHYSTHQFAIIVRGTGWDTYRTWEYLLFGTVPILLKGTPMDHLHMPAHTPVVFVDSWRDICHWDDAFYAKLEARYERWIANAHKWLRPSLWVPRNQTEMERLCDVSPGCRGEPSSLTERLGDAWNSITSDHQGKETPAIRSNSEKQVYLDKKSDAHKETLTNLLESAKPGELQEILSTHPELFAAIKKELSLQQ